MRPAQSVPTSPCWGPPSAPPAPPSARRAELGHGGFPNSCPSPDGSPPLQQPPRVPRVPPGWELRSSGDVPGCACSEPASSVCTHPAATRHRAEAPTSPSSSPAQPRPFFGPPFPRLRSEVWKTWDGWEPLRPEYSKSFLSFAARPGRAC